MRPSRFFFLLIFSLIFISNLTQTVNANETTTDYSIVTQNFDISCKSPSTDSQIKIDVGGKRFVDFQNMGIFSTSTGKVIYKGLLTLQFSINLYTTYDLKTAYNSIVKSPKSTQWLHIVADPNWADEKDRLNIYGTAIYNSYSLGTPAAGINNLPFELSVEWADFDTLYYNNANDTLTIAAPTISAVESRTVNHTVQALEFYSDIFTEAEEIKLDAIDLKNNGLTGSCGDAQGDVNLKISDLALGVVASPAIPQPITSQQSIVSAMSDGKILTKTGNNAFQFTVKNIPEVIYYKQDITTSAVQTMNVDTQDGIILKDAGIKYVSPKLVTTATRVCGYRVNNFVLKETFETDFVCFTELNIDPARQEYYLSLPEVQKGDVIWDIAFTGTTGASLVFTEKQNALGDFLAGFTFNIGIYAIIGIVAIIAILYFTPLGKTVKKLIFGRLGR